MAWIIRGADQNGPNITSPNYISVPIDFSVAGWLEQATHEVFTVTGLVRMRMWIECTEDVAGAGSIQFGYEGVTNAFIASTVGTAIDNGDLWYDNTPTLAVDVFTTATLDYVINGSDVGYEITGAALSDGNITIHCVWDAMNATGNVAVGDGTAL